MNYKKTVAIIGAGPAGCMCAFFAQEKYDVTLFDFQKPLQTLLYTGGGRCNLAFAEYDFKELAKNYPRGEKFLYSVLSKFSTAETIDFFEKIGVKTYTQDDLRIFPTSNSAKEVREKFLNNLNKSKFKKEKILEITKKESCFLLKTENNSYKFDKVVISVGGHGGFSLAKKLGHKIIEPKPSLIGLITQQNLKLIQGISIKNVSATVIFEGKRVVKIKDDLLFTHFGISGPLSYKISSICARFNYSKQNPIKINLDFIQKDIKLQGLLNSKPKKDVKNLISEFVPKALSEYILISNKIDLNLKCSEVNGKMREMIEKSLEKFEVTVISPAKEGEIVTSGGVSLDEINSKDMQSKIIEGLYFCGEVIDVDGFCGGFNLQNCWSTGYICGENLSK